jgi:hypothetical protein
MVEQLAAQLMRAKAGQNLLKYNSKSLKRQKRILSENKQLTCATNYLSLSIESL